MIKRLLAHSTLCLFFYIQSMAQEASHNVSPIVRSCFEHVFALAHQDNQKLDFSKLSSQTLTDKTSSTESEYKFFIKSTQTTAFLRAHLSNHQQLLNQQWLQQLSFTSPKAGDIPRQELDNEFNKQRSLLGLGPKPFEIKPDAYTTCHHYAFSTKAAYHYVCEIDNIEVEVIKKFYEEWLAKEKQKKEAAKEYHSSFEQFKHYFISWMS